MKKTGTAFFVDFPRILDELKQPHLLKAERPYEIAATVTLGKMDYDNFTKPYGKTISEIFAAIRKNFRYRTCSIHWICAIVFHEKNADAAKISRREKRCNIRESSIWIS